MSSSKGSVSRIITARWGGSRRTWLHGIEKVSKRYLMSAMAHNLGLVMRTLFGMGAARSLQEGRGIADYLCLVLFNTWTTFESLRTPTPRSDRQKTAADHSLALAA